MNGFNSVYKHSFKAGILNGETATPVCDITTKKLLQTVVNCVDTSLRKPGFPLAGTSRVLDSILKIFFYVLLKS